MVRKLTLTFLAAAPVALLAFSTGPPLKRTGAPVDGGLNCTACHRTYAPANSDPRGSVAIAAASYTPGVKQTIKVTVSHPDALRWGFQMTARYASDPSKQAGSFTTNDVVRVRCDSTPAHDAPCDGALEFPEHASAPVTAAGVGFTFSVDWTPPATNVGDITFYAAGNAANNDATNGGDRIYTTGKTISGPCGATVAPSVSSVVNGASFQAGITPNGMVTIFGQNFAAAGFKRSIQLADIANKAFPKAMSCLAVEIDGKRAPLTYIQSDQINVQAPTSTNVGPVSVKVIANPDLPNQLASNTMTANQGATAPALFTFDGKSAAALSGGSGAVVADPALVPGAKPAQPSDVVSLYATGLGPTNPGAQAGDITDVASRVGLPLKVIIGGVTLADADITYAGLSPGSISGLYQLNVKVPATAPDGNASLVVQSFGINSPDGVYIPVKR